MPLKFNLKKSRHYNVTSKNLFVICVHHFFDTPSTVDCTLSSESTGQECLINVCQRLYINQPEFFGLRYIAKGTTDELKWIDLERPISRQLEKFAACPKLFLRVMHYVTNGVVLLTDENSKDYYFHQLKYDVVEGIISCDPQQAVILAIYFWQAIYDNQQKDKHTVDYMKTLLPFPKQFVEAGLLQQLTIEVMRKHSEIQNFSQPPVDLYITACQQLEGYGTEKFLARDNLGNEVILGLTIEGISSSSVTTPKTTVFYPWSDITNVVNYKRSFTIECAEPQYNVGFNFTDSDAGRYVWNLCVLKHTFYMNHKDCSTSEDGKSNHNLFKNMNEDMSSSKENIFGENMMLHSSDTHLAGSTNSSKLNLAISTDRLTNNEQFWNMASNERLYQNNNFIVNNTGGAESIRDSNMSLNYQMQSSSCLDLSNNAMKVVDRKRLNELLPGYRPAPDYETAMQQKRMSQNDLHHKSGGISMSGYIGPNRLSSSHVNVYLSGSQPDVHRSTVFSDSMNGINIQQRYPDVTHTTNPMYINHGAINHVMVEPLAPRINEMPLSHPSQLHQLYYSNRLNSTSTPDLALASHAGLIENRESYVSGSSPDLVSSRTLLNTQYIPNRGNYFVSAPGFSNHFVPNSMLQNNYMPLRKTYEKLNMLEQNSHLLPSPVQTMGSTVNTTGIDNGNGIAYYVPVNSGAFLTRPTSTSNPLNGSIEPIYENVPYNWQNDTNSNNIRDRTSSIQSAPAFIRSKQLTNLTENQTNQTQLNDAILSKQTPTSSAVPQSINTTNIEQKLADVVLEKKYPNDSETMNSTEDTSKGQNLFISVKQNPVRATSLGPTFNGSINSSIAGSVNTSTSSSVMTNSSQKKEKRSKIWRIFGVGGQSKNKNKSIISNQSNDTVLGVRSITTLPRGHSLSTQVSKEKLSQMLEAKLMDSQLFREFEAIPKRKENAKFDFALIDVNKSLCADPHFLPYDDNRVRICPTKNNRLGFVNASTISATVGSKQRFYIVAQSPHTTVTLDIFWQTIWEADVYLVVQLSDDINYIPKNNESIEFGQFNVTEEHSQESGICETSKLCLTHKPSKRYRSVWHLTYRNWTEQNCPKDPIHFIKFLEELSTVRLASANEIPPGHNMNPPILIHCNDACGRSGVVLASDLLLYTLDHNQDLDVPRVIGQLRQQRDSIIPSILQYKFIYSILYNYLKQTRLI